MPPRTKSSSSQSIEARIVDVGSGLARAFSNVLEAIPGAPHRPQFLARTLGVNTVLTSRLLKAAQQTDPLVVAHVIPGPEPLRRLLRAAAKKKIDPALIEQARAAVDRFEQLIDAEAGDRSSLDAIISGWLPDALERVQLIAKQSVFRGMSHLLGCACDVQHCSMILHPAGPVDPERADALCLFISRGLRRVRPGLPVDYQSVHGNTPMLTPAGQPIENLQGLLMEDFCSKPLPKLHVTRFPGFAMYSLAGEDVGRRSAVELAYATYLPRKRKLHRAPGDPPCRAPLALGVGLPCRAIVFDVLLHDDVFPNPNPDLGVYRTVGVFNRGSPDGSAGAEVSDERRERDRLDVADSIQSLGRGVVKFRCADTPRYQDMIRQVCQQRDWDPDTLRGYRCRIEYPIYSSEIVMSFDVPEARSALASSAI